MAGVQCIDVQFRPTEFLDLTSLTPDEFELLIPPFEEAFQAHMAVWRLDGKPRTSRQFSVYKNCPLPTPQDRLFFLLTYLKTYSLQVSFRVVCSAWARARRTSGFTPYCRPCKPRLSALEILRPVP